MASTFAELHNDFSWPDYLEQLGQDAGQAAPASCFKQAALAPVNNFQPGQRLEAKDPRNQDNTCIATVIECLGPRLRLRLDGSDDRNDFYRLADSEDLFCHPSGRFIVPPLGYAKSMSTWPAFLARIRSAGNFAPADCFKQPPPAPPRNAFQPGQRLEAVDRKHPQLVCPATVREIRQDRLLVSFDGWRGAFDYWCRYDSRDIFPVGWCASAGYPVQPPGSSVPYSPRLSGSNRGGDSADIVDVDADADADIDLSRPTRVKAKQASGASGVSTASPSAFSERSVSPPPLPPSPNPVQPKQQQQCHETASANMELAESGVRFNDSDTKQAEPVDSKDCDHESLEPASVPPPPPPTEPEEDVEPEGDMSAWSISDVGRGVRHWRLAELASLLRCHSVDGRALQSLTADRLVLGMGARVGPALKLLSRVEKARRRQNLLQCLRALQPSIKR